VIFWLEIRSACISLFVSPVSSAAHPTIDPHTPVADFRHAARWRTHAFPTTGRAHRYSIETCPNSDVIHLPVFASAFECGDVPTNGCIRFCCHMMSFAWHSTLIHLFGSTLRLNARLFSLCSSLKGELPNDVPVDLMHQSLYIIHEHTLIHCLLHCLSLIQCTRSE
jgi:hypothetical protein